LVEVVFPIDPALAKSPPKSVECADTEGPKSK
jgi:hypothetical protein